MNIYYIILRLIHFKSNIPKPFWIFKLEVHYGSSLLIYRQNIEVWPSHKTKLAEPDRAKKNHSQPLLYTFTEYWPNSQADYRPKKITDAAYAVLKY